MSQMSPRSLARHTRFGLASLVSTAFLLSLASGTNVQAPNSAELYDAGFEIPLLGQAERAARGQLVVETGRLVLAGHIEQVCADGVHPVVPRRG